MTISRPGTHTWVPGRLLWPGAFLALACAIWLLRAPTANLPLERDEGAYAVIARDWRAGAVPYRDRFDHKPPFVYLAYMPSGLLGADRDAAGSIRLWATLWLIATVAAAWWAARLLWHSNLAGLVAAILVGAWGSGLMVQGITFNSEAVMMLPGTLALGALLRGLHAEPAGRPERPSFGWWLLAGALIALAALSKPIGVLIVPAALVAALGSGRGAAWRRRSGRNLALVLGGGLLAAAPFAAYFALAGAWEAARIALLDYNLRYAAESAQQPLGLVRTLWPVWKPLLPLAAAGLAGLLWGVGGQAIRDTNGERQSGIRSRAALATALAWSAGLIGGAIASLRPYPHYYLAAVPALAVWAGGLGRQRWPKGPRRRRAVGLILALALAGGLALPPIQSIAPFRGETPAQQTERLYGLDGREFFATAPAVIDWIDRQVGPQASLWVWAAEPELYLLGGRAVPTRFPYDYPLALLPGARDEVLATLRQRPPEVIVTYGGVRPEGFDIPQSLYGYVMRVHLGGYDIWTRPPR